MGGDRSLISVVRSRHCERFRGGGDTVPRALTRSWFSCFLGVGRGDRGCVQLELVEPQNGHRCQSSFVADLTA